MRPLVRSLVIDPGTPTERTRLLGIYPASLFVLLPNLRRWDMRAPVDAKTNPSVQKVSFHPTTLIQLRYSPITELCVSSMQFTSRGEFVRLISSLSHLRVLQYTNVTFVPSTTASHNPRRPLGLSTLQVSGRVYLVGQRSCQPFHTIRSPTGRRMTMSYLGYWRRPNCPFRHWSFVARRA